MLFATKCKCFVYVCFSKLLVFFSMTHSNLCTVFSFQLSEWSPIHWKKDIFSTPTLFVQKLQIENYYHVCSMFFFLWLTLKNFTWVLQRSLLWCLLNWVHWIRITRLTVSLWSSCDGSRGSSSAQFITIGCIYYFWQLTDRERDYQEDPNQLDLAILSCQDTDLSSRLTSHQTKSTVSQPC